MVVRSQSVGNRDGKWRIPPRVHRRTSWVFEHDTPHHICYKKFKSRLIISECVGISVPLANAGVYQTIKSKGLWLMYKCAGCGVSFQWEKERKVWILPDVVSSSALYTGQPLGSSSSNVVGLEFDTPRHNRCLKSKSQVVGKRVFGNGRALAKGGIVRRVRCREVWLTWKVVNCKVEVGCEKGAESGGSPGDVVRVDRCCEILSPTHPLTATMSMIERR